MLEMSAVIEMLYALTNGQVNFRARVMSDHSKLRVMNISQTYRPKSTKMISISIPVSLLSQREERDLDSKQTSVLFDFSQ
jgi:hypothetical protein